MQHIHPLYKLYDSHGYVLQSLNSVARVTLSLALHPLPPLSLSQVPAAVDVLVVNELICFQHRIILNWAMLQVVPNHFLKFVSTWVLFFKWSFCYVKCLSWNMFPMVIFGLLLLEIYSNVTLVEFFMEKIFHCILYAWSVE